MKPPKITVLVSARKNSKYLAQFLFGLFDKTWDFKNMQVLVMLNKHDTWNHELVHFFMPFGVRFMMEDEQLGRAGLHIYFNQLLPKALGDWIIYFCEDHFITMPAWDKYVRDLIIDRELDPAEPYCLIPKFDNCGAMNHILSRGYIDALGGILGRHGWIDSYINEVNAALPPDRIIRFDDEMFHDFTHDHPSPMDDSHMQSQLGPAASLLPRFESPVVRQLAAEDAAKVNNYLINGR